MSKTLVLLAVVPLAVLGCNDPPPGKPSTGEKAGAAPAPVAQGANMGDAFEVFTQRCAPCHGANGRGDGAGAAALRPKPRDYTDGAWQKSVTDEQLRKTILQGGAAVGKSPMMPASPDLERKPETVEGLVKLIRGFGPK